MAEALRYEDLVSYFADGCKPAKQWRIGTEHEKFLFQRTTLRPMGYDDGIRQWLDAMTKYQWQPVVEDDHTIALERDGASITLEPGGQIELSGAPLECLHDTCAEIHQHLREAMEAAKPIQGGFLGMGFLPQWRRDDVPWMPKQRYRIMRRYMPTKGDLGLDMMLRTCTIQGNFDYDSEATMRRCFRLALALQPVAVALFACSPFREGKDCGYLSYRSHVWTDTDADRCGVPSCVFEDGFGFERYCDYILDVPMYFVRRDQRYICAAGQSFRDFLAGRLPALVGEYPTLEDWKDHISTVFTEARLKTFLEVRGADCGDVDSLCALSAFWCGLLYDDAVRDAAWDMVKDWSMERHLRLRRQTPRLGLDVMLGKQSMGDFAKRILELSAAGLRRRARLDRKNQDEGIYLAPLQETLERGVTPAQVLLQRWHDEWRGSIDALYQYCAYR